MLKKGRLFILSGPSGCGKDTILKEVLTADPRVKLSISTITRAMREGEREGEKYHFISRGEFERLLAQNAFLEYNEYLGNDYGTPKKPIENWLADGYDVLLEIDVNGAQKVRSLLPQTPSIFILPPSMAVLRERLSGRGTETAEVLKRRLAEAAREISQAGVYDYLVVNDELETAVGDILAILRAHKCTNQEMGEFMKEVQKDAESRNW